MRKLIALSAALGAAPILILAVMQTAAPAFADTPGVSPTCFPQTMNPHPTDLAGGTTNTLFCTPTDPNGSGSAGSGSGGSGSAGNTGAGTTAGGNQSSLASSSGTTGSFPDESGHVNGATGLHGTWSGAGQPAASNSTGLFGGLVSFFATAGGLVFLFGLLMLALFVLVAIAATALLRRAPAKDWASRFSRLTFRA